MRPRASFVVFVLPLLAAGCTSDLNAPSNYKIPEGAESTGPGPIALECGEVPRGAVAANYSHTPTAMGGDESYTFESPDLPDGLVIDAATGAITGNPTTAGTFDFTVNVVDTAGGMGSQMCTVEISERLGVDLDAALLADQPYCLTGGSLLDFIVPGTGDGSPIVCEHSAGSGNGRRPDGISVNAEACTIEGTLQETRFGTYVFVMRGEQNGVSVHMPYCVTQDNADFAYDVSADHSGLTDAALVPIGRRFNPNASFSVGEDGDPLFNVIDAAACGANSCFFGFSFGINSSPFDADTFALPNRSLVYDDMMAPIGFTHGLQIDGPEVSEEFKTRPWVVNISLDYCLSENDVDCEGAGNTVANGDGHLELGIIMVPEAP